MSFNVAVYSFTEKGKALAEKISKIKLNDFRDEKIQFHIADGKNITRDDFHSVQGHIFIGAVGIAVRKIAPYLESKLTDPAVIVIDECMQYVIPILSGHIGGGNELADMLAKEINSLCIITTATDINGYKAIDSIAASKGMLIKESDGIKKINAKILSEEEISIASDGHVDVIISSDLKDRDKATLHIYNRRIVLGIGCRKDIATDIFHDTVNEVLSELDLTPDDVWKIASIDLKANEKAIIDYSKKYSIKFITYSASELSEAEGDFDESSFVKDVTGVSNVSERAASLCGGRGSFIQKRVARNGITISVFEVQKIVKL